MQLRWLQLLSKKRLEKVNLISEMLKIDEPD